MSLNTKYPLTDTPAIGDFFVSHAQTHIIIIIIIIIDTSRADSIVCASRSHY